MAPFRIAIRLVIETYKVVQSRDKFGNHKIAQSYEKHTQRVLFTDTLFAYTCNSEVHPTEQPDEAPRNGLSLLETETCTTTSFDYLLESESCNGRHSSTEKVSHTESIGFE